MVSDTLEAYYDAVLRRFARVEEVGPFRVYLDAPTGWTFPARPAPGRRHGYDADAVAAVLTHLRERRIPQAIEWVHDPLPALLEAVREEGSLTVTELPLMALSADAAEGLAVPPAGLPEACEVRMLGPDEAHLLEATRGVTRAAFGGTLPAAALSTDPAPEPEPGTASAALRHMLRSGEARIAIAEHPERGVVATGRHLPLGGATEVVGVATLPTEQGAGLGSAVTRRLVADALTLRVGTVFLTAGSERVARLYGRVGFLRIGTCYEAARD